MGNAKAIDVVVSVQERSDGWWVITDGPEDIVPAEARAFGPAPNELAAREHATDVARLLSVLHGDGSVRIGNPNRN